MVVEPLAVVEPLVVDTLVVVDTLAVVDTLVVAATYQSVVVEDPLVVILEVAVRPLPASTGHQETPG